MQTRVEKTAKRVVPHSSYLLFQSIPLVSQKLGVRRFATWSSSSKSGFGESKRRHSICRSVRDEHRKWEKNVYVHIPKRKGHYPMPMKITPWENRKYTVLPRKQMFPGSMQNPSLKRKGEKGHSEKSRFYENVFQKTVNRAAPVASGAVTLAATHS